MKNGAASGASIFLKHIISALCSITKAKSMAIRNKTSTLKARLAVMSLLKNKKFSLGSISHKIQAVLGQQDKIRSEDEDHDEEEEDKSKAIVLYNASAPSGSDHEYYYGYGDDDKYPDLTHTLFVEEEDELDLGDPNGSVIDLVRSSKEGGDEDFKLEDEIDHVADLFILKFHKRIRLQKLESFKRYQEMLQRGV